MDRRAFIAGMTGAFLAVPLAEAQQAGKVYRIGLLDHSAPDDSRLGWWQSFKGRLRELGYVEGQNVVFEPRWAEEDASRLPGLAAELVRLKVHVIVTAGSATAPAAWRATTTIPIVVTVVPDPVRDGFAMSLAKPGGNITGLSSGTAEVIQKHVELLATAAPRITRFAVLLNPANPGHPPLLLSVQVAAQRSGRQVLPVAASSPEEIERGFASMTRNGADALIVLVDSVFRQHRRQITGLALKHRLPASYANLEFADAGGLFIYATNQIENFRRAAIYVDKIFKGAKPGELPFELPTRYQLVINRKTATALGLTLPQELLLRADKVIE